MVEQYGECADTINGYPRYVVSTKLEEPLGWNNSALLKSNVAEKVTRLKRQAGKEL
jgi:hypothetical protein